MGNKKRTVAVIGGGASGLAAAIAAAEAGAQVTVLEKASRVGRKILASGNGRCNLMNLGPAVYFGDPAFAESNRRAIAICDALAEQTGESVRRAMTDIFVKATRLEWLFWDSAYRKEVWPI